MSKLRQSVRFWVSISIYGCVFLGQPLWAAQKSALIIGNSRYLLGDRLTNPQNDAEDIANKLKSLGFDVILLKDANLAQMLDSIDQFKNKLRQGDVALFYFAGHGLQVDGQNYLVPVDAKMNSRSRVAYEAVKLSDVSNALAQGNITNNIIIIDACRNDPFPKELRDGSRGLARLDSSVRSPKKKLFYLFASAPGTTADDGKGRNGIFTQELLKYLGQAGLTMPDLYEAVSNGVLAASNNKQEVYHEGDMLARFSLVPSPVKNNVVAPVPAQTQEPRIDQKINDTPNVSRNQFSIPISMEKETVDLVLGSGSIEDKQHWFNIWPSMSKHQREKLIKILKDENTALFRQGLWRDPKTKLLWMHCSFGQTWNGKTCSGKAKIINWSDAMKAGNNLNYGGVTGWRLPTIDELKTLMIKDKAGYASAFILKPKSDDFGSYWSSSPAVYDNDLAGIVYFDMGKGSSYHKSGNMYVRLVLSEQ